MGKIPTSPFPCQLDSSGNRTKCPGARVPRGINYSLCSKPQQPPWVFQVVTAAGSCNSQNAGCRVGSPSLSLSGWSAALFTLFSSHLRPCSSSLVTLHVQGGRGIAALGLPLALGFLIAPTSSPVPHPTTTTSSRLF